MSDSPVVFETSDRIATITLNRPQKLNALDVATLTALDAAVARARADVEVSAILLTGAGDKAFAAGADIRELAAMSPTAARLHARFGQSVLERIESSPKPVVAAINGFALGGGCELAMAAHLRVASDRAEFGQPEVNLGLLAGFAGTQRLPRLVGKGRALDLLLTGRRLSAADALDWGLVNQVTPAESLLAAARGLLAEIQRRAPLAVAMTLEAVRHGLDVGFAEGQRHEASLFGLAFATADMKEGTAAFLERREAKFTGR